MQNFSETEIKVNEILTAAGIKYSAKYIGETVKDNDWKCDEWRCSFRNASGKAEKFEYFTGLGLRVVDEAKFKQHKARYSGAQYQPAPHPRSIAGVEIAKSLEACKVPSNPAAVGVLYSLLNNGAEYNFIDWCDSFGYDSDSIKALNTYNACCTDDRRIKSVIGSGAVLQDLQTALENY